MFIYYVYAYLRKKDGSPYYIGKGKDNRAFSKKHRVPVPKDNSRIVFLEKNLSEIGSLSLERRMIKWYGRKDLGTGILLNLTDGGETNYGYKPSEETKLKIGLANKGKKRTAEEKYANSQRQKGRILNSEWKEKINKAKVGRKVSKETREKLSHSNKGQTRSEEAKLKMKESALKRAPTSEETKAKMALAQKERWLKIKSNLI